MLQIEGIDVYYGKAQALSDASITVGEEEIVSVIGANGAGKSTLMKTISGLVHPTKGKIFFRGKEIQRMPPHDVVRQGIVHVPEGRRVFPELSVYDNLLMGAYSRKYSRTQLTEKLDEQYEFFPKLRERNTQLAGSLSGGEQQMLAIARGLMAEPTLLMLDEPSLGLAPIIIENIFDIILKINQIKKLPVILVEQNAYMALEASTRGYVLELGQIRHEGTSECLLANEDIKKAYLGG